MPKRQRATASISESAYDMSRRDFVARAGLVGAGLAGGPLLWSGCSGQSLETGTAGGRVNAPQEPVERDAREERPYPPQRLPVRPPRPR